MPSSSVFGCLLTPDCVSTGKNSAFFHTSRIISFTARIFALFRVPIAIIISVFIQPFLLVSWLWRCFLFSCVFVKDWPAVFSVVSRPYAYFSFPVFYYCLRKFFFNCFFEL